MKSILVVSKKEHTYRLILSAFKSTGTVKKATEKTAALELLQKQRIDIIFIDLIALNNMDTGENYQEALMPFWQLNPSAEIIVITPQETIRNAVKAGANDYLTCPLNAEELNLLSGNINKTRILQSELNYLRDQSWRLDSCELVRTNSSAMNRVFQQIDSVAPTKSTVLLTGETGTGKNVLAQLIHKQSNRTDDQFISVHCGAIPDTLIESEMFGHEKGAFTNAVSRKMGKFQLASGGTIFLDDICTITPAAQIKLPQFLEGTGRVGLFGGFHGLSIPFVWCQNRRSGFGRFSIKSW